MSSTSTPTRFPQPKSMEELENSSAEDPLANCWPWLEFTTCQCKFPALGSVLINSVRPDIDSVYEDGSSEDGSEHSDKEQGREEHEENDVAELDDEQGDEEEDSVPVFTEYVGLRGSSWHEDYQSTLMKC